MKRKLTAMLLIPAVLLSGTGACAETIKHERVYVVAGADGQVQSLTDSIRLENRDSQEEIADLSMLENIENTGGDEAFSQDGESVIWQADGKDIVYQGTSDKAPAVVPRVTVTVDGKEADASALSSLTGDVTLTVSCEAQETLPMLAVTLIPLPEDGVENLQTTQALQISEAGRKFIAGITLPGMEDALADLALSDEAKEKLPEGLEDRFSDTFTVSFHADNVSLSWMMTAASADPVRLLAQETDGMLDADALQKELGDVSSLLHAMEEGTELPATEGRTAGFGPKVNELNQGLSDLDDGAASLSEGASSLSSGASDASAGAAALHDGLSELSGNNETLNSGMAALFDAILSVANEKLASSGLADAGIEIPELTAENYDQVLTGAMGKLDPDALRENAIAQASEQIRPQVEANEAEIRDGVVREVRHTVLAAVLEAAGEGVTVDEYMDLAQTGQIPALKQAGIDAAVEEQMNSEDVQAKIDAAVEEQIDKITREHAEEYLDSDETISAQLEQAGEGYAQLKGLKDQLDQAAALVEGVASYTDGVSQAESGASDLAAGLVTLDTGAQSLSTGASDLSEGVTTLRGSIEDAEKQAAEALLPYVEGDLPSVLKLFADTEENAGKGGYDLLPEDMTGLTVYIIRTQLGE